MADIDNLTQFEKDTLLNHLLYKMKMDMRGEIMEQYPMIYNKLCGREIVKVVRTEDGSPASEMKETVLKVRLYDIKNGRVAE